MIKGLGFHQPLFVNHPMRKRKPGNIIAGLLIVLLCAGALAGRGTSSGIVVTNAKDYHSGLIFLPSYVRATNLGELIVVYTNSTGGISVQNGRYYFLNSVLMTNNASFTVSSGYDLSSIPPAFSANGRIGSYIDYVYIITNRANISDQFFLRVLPLATDDSNWTGNRLSLFINGSPAAADRASLFTNTASIPPDSVLNIRVRLDIPLTVARGSTNLLSFEIWNTVWNTNTMSGDQWPGSQAIPPALPDVLDNRDYQRSFLRTRAYGIYHAVVVPSADDMIHTIYKLDGTEHLGTAKVRINVLLDSPPADRNEFYLIYNIDQAPTGSRPDDVRVRLEGDGINYYALILGETDRRIREGSVFRFIIQCDGEMYYRDGVSGFSDWSFVFKNILMQRNNVSILNNLLNPRKGEKAIIFYSLGKASRVTIEVYSLAGEKVATLFSGHKSAGYQDPVFWDGKNAGGREVAEGLYFVNLRTDEINELRKVIVVK